MFSLALPPVQLVRLCKDTVVFFHCSWCSSVSIRGLICERIETGRRPAPGIAAVRNAVELAFFAEKAPGRRRFVSFPLLSMVLYGIVSGIAPFSAE